MAWLGALSVLYGFTVAQWWTDPSAARLNEITLIFTPFNYICYKYVLLSVIIATVYGLSYRVTRELYLKKLNRRLVPTERPILFWEKINLFHT